MSAHWGLPVGVLMRSMSSEEFTYQLAYYALEPWGEERADLRNAVHCSILANVNRSKGSKAFEPKDFMLRFDKPKLKYTANMLEAYFRGLAANQARKST
jgi:hypothetical protein